MSSLKIMTQNVLLVLILGLLMLKEAKIFEIQLVESRWSKVFGMFFFPLKEIAKGFMKICCIRNWEKLLSFSLENAT